MFKSFRHLKLQRPLVVLDLETTGTDPADARIVQIAALKIPPKGGTMLRTKRVNPGVPIPPAATAVHGIRDSDVAGCPAFASIAKGVLRFIEDCDLAGYNIKSYDLSLLVTELARCGLELPLDGRAVLDAMQIYFEHEPRDLSSALLHFCGEEHDGAHAAERDVVAAAKILDAQLRRYRDLPRDVRGLHRQFADVDIGGRFRRENGQILFNFGKYRGCSLDEVADGDPDYLQWMLGAGFLDDVKHLVRRALHSGQ